MSTYFNIKNRTEAEQFDKYLKEYYESNCHFPFHTYLKLIDWFDWCQNSDNGGKIFASIFDIKLNYIFLDLESIKCINIWESRDKNTNILNNVNDFKLSVDLLRHLSTYVLKYRALIDKLMGLIFLCYAPEEYDKFRRGESRKSIFKKIFANKKIPLKIDPENLFAFLDQFDKKYRTPEAHATGSMRKWIFSDINLGLEDYYRISLDSWNGLINIISEIDRIKN